MQCWWRMMKIIDTSRMHTTRIIVDILYLNIINHGKPPLWLRIVDKPQWCKVIYHPTQQFFKVCYNSEFKFITEIPEPDNTFWWGMEVYFKGSDVYKITQLWVWVCMHICVHARVHVCMFVGEGLYWMKAYLFLFK